jgi:hypothetical protein
LFLERRDAQNGAINKTLAKVYQRYAAYFDDGLFQEYDLFLKLILMNSKKNIASNTFVVWHFIFSG